MTERIIQNPNTKCSGGLAIGWGIPESIDPEIKKALPEWSIVVTDYAPASVIFQDYAGVRRLTGALRTARLIVFGFGTGAITVRTLLLSRFVDVWAAVAATLPI